MKIEEFQQLAASRGYVVKDSAIFGESGGYPFSMTAVRSGKRITVSATFRTAGLFTKQLIKDLKRAAPKKTGIIRTAGRKDSVTATMTGRDEAFFPLVDETLRAVVSFLRSAMISPSSECPVCSRGGTDAYALYGGAYTAVHKACIEESCNNTVAKIEKQQAHGSYLLGFVGALLGALVGAIPNFVTIYFMHYIIGYLCALIPLVSYAGYRLFRGKPNRPATIIIMFCSLIQAFVLEFSWWYAELFVRDLGIWPSVIAAGEVYINSFKYMDGDRALELIKIAGFVCFGIAMCFALISQTAKSKLKSTMGVLETLRDKPAAPGAAPAAPIEADTARQDMPATENFLGSEQE